MEHWTYGRLRTWRTGKVVNGEVWIISDGGEICALPVATLGFIPVVGTEVRMHFDTPSRPLSLFPPTAKEDEHITEDPPCLVVVPRLRITKWARRAVRRTGAALARIAEIYARTAIASNKLGGGRESRAFP